MKTKRYISLFMAALLCMVFQISVGAAEGADILIHSTSSKLAVVGNLSKDTAGDDISLLLLKNAADPQNLTEGDIGYIEDTKVEADGSYTFKFPFAGVRYENGAVSNYKVYVTHKNKNGEDVNVTTSVTEATAVPEFTHTVLDIKPGVTTFNASVKVDNLFGLENIGYNLFVGCYDSEGKLVRVFTTNDKAVPADRTSDALNITVPDGTNMVKAFVFNNTSGIIPLCKDEVYT